MDQTTLTDEQTDAHRRAVLIELARTVLDGAAAEHFDYLDEETS